MEPRYYFSIRFIPEHTDNELLAGRCVSNMHGFLSHERNRSFKNCVGVCFPRWSEKTVGNEIVFVSPHESILTGLSYQPYFSTMVNEGLFDISDIKIVPDDVEEVQFVFNKTIQKIFNGSKREESNVRCSGPRCKAVFIHRYQPKNGSLSCSMKFQSVASHQVMRLFYIYSVNSLCIQK